MKVFFSIWICCFGVLGLNASGKDLAGVSLEEVVTVSPGGAELRLRGAAVKNSAHQAIYVGGLYLQNHAADNAQEIIADNGSKRFVLFCQNSSIKPQDFIRALNLGIISNHTEQELTSLEPMINQFNQIWNLEIKQGDMVWIDFIPDEGTIISINGDKKGSILGKSFYDAFLKTWIGDKPLNALMKKQLLGDS